MTDTPRPGAGWYDDPEQDGQQRYWDGTSWTEHRQPKTPVPAAGTVAMAPITSNGLATAGMVVGIIALFFAWIPLVGVIGLLLGLLALVFGVIGRRNVTRGVTAVGQGAATGAIVMGVIAVLLFGLATVLPLIAVSVAGDEIESVFETCPDGSLALIGEC